MKPKTMILMVVAVACGLVASYMTSRLLADRNTAPADNMVTVVVAKKKVPQLTLIRNPEELFELRSVRDDGTITAKAVQKLEDLQNKRLKNSISEGSAVRQDDLQKKEDMILEVPLGQRAVAIQVNAKILAGGFILPGTRVDVLSTMKRGEEPSSMLLLQNMLVLAVDLQSTREDGRQTMLGQTVTLAATPYECQQLALGAQQGELCLTLRSPEDKRLVTASVTKIGDLGKGARDRNQETGEYTEAPPETAPGLVNLPKVQDPPQPMVPTPPVVVQPEVKTPEAPPDPVVQLEKHTLTVEIGQFSQQYVFTKDPETGNWRGGRGANGEDEQPARKPAPKEAPKAKVGQ